MFGPLYQRSAANVWGTARFWGPLAGAAFFAAGSLAIWSLLQCRGVAIPALIGPLEVRSGPTLWYIGAGTLLAAYIWRHVPLPLRIVPIAGATLWFFAVDEAAEFHVGVQADRWGTIAFAVPLLLVVASFVQKRLARGSGKSDQPSAPADVVAHRRE